MRRYGILFFLSLMTWSCIGVSETNPSQKEAEAPLEIQSIQGTVLINNVAVKTGFSFKEGIIQAQGESSSITTTYFDGDSLTLKNGEAKIEFAVSDSILSMMESGTSPETNLNIRIIRLSQGTISFKLKLHDAVSKVSYQLLIGNGEIHFKDADLTVTYKERALITVDRGEVKVVLDSNKPAAEPVLVKAGNPVDIGIE